MADGTGGKRRVTIGVTRFKAECLALIDQVGARRLDEVVLTKRGRPVARLAAIAPEARPATSDGKPFTLHGAMKGLMHIPDGVDLTEPTSDLIDWDPFGEPKD